MCKWIRHDLQTDILKVSSEYIIVVQSIRSHQSRVRSYDATNRGTKQSANADTSKKIKFPFGIALKNISNGFVKSKKLKHRKSLTSTIHCKRKFSISVNWVKIIACQTGLPRNVCKLYQHENSKLPILRYWKHSQTDSKWLKIWNIDSQVWTLNIPKVVNHKTFQGARYSNANKPSCHCLTLWVKCRFGKCSKQDFTEWLRMTI